MLYDSIHISKTVYNIKYKIPYSKSKGIPSWSKKKLYSKRRTYMLTKLWNKDLVKANVLYDKIKALGRYDKVHIHKGCVYASRRIESDY